MPEECLTVEDFAKRFSFNKEYVRRMIRGAEDLRTGRCESLPVGCRAIKIGRQYFIFVETTEFRQAKKPKPIKELLNTLSERELANLLAQRWSCPSPLDANQQKRPLLAQPDRFVWQLERAYSRAISENQATAITLTFKPDGEWEAEADPADLLLALTIGRKETNTSLAFDFAMAWHGQVNSLIKTGTNSTRPPASGSIDPEFLRLCLHCGSKLPNEAIARAARYHTKKESGWDCRRQHRNWLKGLIALTPTERATKIARKAKEKTR